jgi:hypothetical protein
VGDQAFGDILVVVAEAEHLRVLDGVQVGVDRIRKNAGTAPASFHRPLVEVANLLVRSLLARTDVPDVGSLPNEGTGLPVGSGPDTSPTRSPHAGKGPPT